MQARGGLDTGSHECKDRKEGPDVVKMHSHGHWHLDATYVNPEIFKNNLIM
jgi:hypothetical protein